MTRRRFVVLLRGVNVGGRNKLPMADLRAALESAGYEDVTTYIQSGNVALSAPTCDGPAISTVIQDGFGLTVPVVVRTADQLRATIADNPFPEMVAEPKFLHVYFCQEPLGDNPLAEVDRERFHPDRMIAGTAEVYVAYPNGVAGSKLTNAVLDRALHQVTTGRNWSTVLRLAEMAEQT
ncbi:MAG: DUF1697 domain-containing protein [Actinomycetota bacterium]